MENSPFLHPAFLLTTALALISLVAWFVRLESKTNGNAKEIERMKIDSSERYLDAKKQRDRIEEDLYKHLMDIKMHYNEQFMAEFRSALNLRFSSLEATLREISSKIERATTK